MKKSIKAISMIAVLTFSLTGCAYNNTVNEVNSALVETTSNEENSTSEATEPTSEETSSTTKETTSSSTIEEKPTTSTTATSTSSTVTKPTEKPAVSSSSSSKPVSSSSKPTSTTTKPVSSSTKPVSSTTSSSSTTTTKPTEKPTHTHNFTNATCTTPATCKICGATKGTVANHNYKDGHCTYCGKSDPNYVAPCKCDEFNPDDPNHDWEITYTTSEPKWCEEMHIISDYGYDTTLAARYLGVTEGEAIQIFWDNMEAIGVNGAGGSATTTVKVWGTETYETKYCKNCGIGVSYTTPVITPMGEWQFLNGQNPRITNPNLDFNTIFYDPYNVPQKVIDNINLMYELIWG